VSSSTKNKRPDSLRLSPIYWDEADRIRYSDLEKGFGQSKPLAEGHKGMVVGNHHAFAIRSGVEVLRQGGNAADAACATALAQVALSTGSNMSYAGVLNGICYDSKTRKVHTLDAGYNIPQGETEPQSISTSPTQIGRSVLVPGFMAGIEALHKRFGVLPFANLFDPAIYIAEEGHEVSGRLAGWMQYRKDILSDLPKTRAIFTGTNGEFYRKGETLRQAKLASTLRNVAQNGVEHIYQGDWAQRFVKAVQQRGGKLSLRDLQTYTPTWEEPICTTYHGHEIYGTPQGRPGGLFALEALNLLELANPQQYGHYTRSAEALYWLIQVSRVGNLLTLWPKEHLEAEFLSLSLSRESRITKAYAQAIWEKLTTPNWMHQFLGLPGVEGSHSGSVVVVDAQKNVAVLGHSNNTATWGTNGIFVEGVSIPDSALSKVNQRTMAEVGGGGRIPVGMNPLIAFKEKKPVLGCCVTGGGIHEEILQQLHNVLDFGMNPKEAIDTPTFLPPMSAPNSAEPWYYRQAVKKGDFSDVVLRGVEKKGQSILELDLKDSYRGLGYWCGITVDPNNNICRGGAPTEFEGYALAE